VRAGAGGLAGGLDFVCVRARVRACMHACVRGLAGAQRAVRTTNLWRFWRLMRVCTVGLVQVDGDMEKVKGASPWITVHSRKILRGTADLREQPAMESEVLADALQVGAEMIRVEAREHGARVVCIGEVGIGNTTSAAALLAALTGSDAASCCGRGTGLDDEGLAHKIRTVEQALNTHRHAVAPASSATGAPSDSEKVRAQAREALRCLGGLEIAGMAGAYMEAARQGIVAVVDGFISAVAALCACRMDPECRRAMIFATALAEEPTSGRGGEILEQALAAKPALNMVLRLGEGSGAALALPMLCAAASVVKDMGTLAEAMALS